MDTYHHGNLRTALLSLARSLVEESRGNGAPSLRELARRAGVSPTAVYHHFSSKEELLAEVAAGLLEELIGTWESAPLEAMGTGYVEFFREHPTALGLVFGPGLRQHPRVRGLQDRAFGLLVGRLPSGQDGGPDEAAGLLVWGLVHGLAHLYQAGVLGCEPEACPGGSPLWYRPPAEVLAALGPLLDRALGVARG